MYLKFGKTADLKHSHQKEEAGTMWGDGCINVFDYGNRFTMCILYTFKLQIYTFLSIIPQLKVLHKNKAE